MEERLVTAETASKYVPWSAKRLLNKRSEGSLPFKSYKWGGKVLFKMSEIQAWIKTVKEEE